MHAARHNKTGLTTGETERERETILHFFTLSMYCWAPKIQPHTSSAPTLLIQRQTAPSSLPRHGRTIPAFRLVWGVGVDTIGGGGGGGRVVGPLSHRKDRDPIERTLLLELDSKHSLLKT